MIWEVYVNERAPKKGIKVFTDEMGKLKILEEEHFALVARPDWTQPYDGPGEVLTRSDGAKIFQPPADEQDGRMVRQFGPLTDDHVVTLRDGRVGCNTLKKLAENYTATGVMWDDKPEPPANPGGA